jgi:hypothetical protein
MNRATLTRDFAPIMGLTERGVRWLFTSARLFVIHTLQRNPMHPDIPRLVIAERELRP